MIECRVCAEPPVFCDHPQATPVTLRRHDSINLTTGVVTRSDREFLPCGHGVIHQGSSGQCLRCVATAKPSFGSILEGHVEGIRANDLESLYSAIRCNASLGMIPMADLEGKIPGTGSGSWKWIPADQYGDARWIIQH